MNTHKRKQEQVEQVEDACDKYLRELFMLQWTGYQLVTKLTAECTVCEKTYNVVKEHINEELADIIFGYMIDVFYLGLDNYLVLHDDTNCGIKSQVAAYNVGQRFSFFREDDFCKFVFEEDVDGNKVVGPHTHQSTAYGMYNLFALMFGCKKQKQNK